MSALVTTADGPMPSTVRMAFQIPGKEAVARDPDAVARAHRYGYRGDVAARVGDLQGDSGSG